MIELTNLKTINLGGKERPLRFNAKAWIEFNKLTGIDVLKGFDPENIGIESMTALLYCGLKGQDKDITLEQVEEWFEPVPGINEAIVTLFKSISESLPEPEGDESPNPQSPEETSTG